MELASYAIIVAAVSGFMLLFVRMWDDHWPPTCGT